MGFDNGLAWDTAGSRGGVPTIASITPTICALFGIAPPASCETAALAPVIEAAREHLAGRPPRRLLVYAPDAVGSHLLRRHPEIAAVFSRVSSMKTPLRSMTPPKTPVCFASMFSGAFPETHGIRRYERPVLRLPTLFDAFIGAGLKVAIIAVKDCSIDMIFRERDIEYYSEPYDPEVTERTLEILRADRHDLVVCYHQAYDDTLHRAGPYAEEAVEAARNHAADYERLCAAAAGSWRAHDHVVVATPDHGGHEVKGPEPRGDHGEDIPEDMDVVHFWRFAAVS